MKKYFLLAAVALLMSGCTVSKRTSFLIVPEATYDSTSAIDVDAYQEKYGEFPGVILLLDETIEHTGMRESHGVLSTWGFHRVSVEKRIVFDPGYGRIASLVVPFKPDSAYMKVTTPDGQVRMYDQSDLEEQKDVYGDKEYVFIYPDIQPGTIIEEGMQVSYNVSYFLPPMKHTVMLQYDVPVEQLRFKYAYPDWWTIGFKQPSEGLAIPIEYEYDSDNKKTSFSFEDTDIPAWRAEPAAPYRMEVMPYLTFHVETFEMKGFKSEIPWTWSERVEKVGENINKKLSKDDVYFASNVVPLIAGIHTDEDKIAAITAFVRDSIEHERTDDPSCKDVFEKRKGDQWDKTMLCARLLKAAGLPFDVYLIHSAEQGYFDRQYISLDQFDLLALGRMVNDTMQVLLPTFEHVPAFYLPLAFQGEPAISLTGDGRIHTAPELRSDQNTLRTTYDVYVDEDGSVTATVVQESTGDIAITCRDSLDKKSDKEVEEIVKGLFSHVEDDVEMSSFEIENLDHPDLPFILRRTYTLQGLVTITPDEVLLQTVGLVTPPDVAGQTSSPEDRLYPVVNRSAREYDKKVTVHYPEQWTLSTILDSVAVVNQFGSARMIYRTAPGRLMMDQHVMFNRHRAPKEAIVDYEELSGRNESLSMPTLVFRRPSLGTVQSGQ